MQQKLKAVFRSASRKKALADQVDDRDARSPRSARAGRSLDEQRRRQSGDVHGGGAQNNGRSRPLSSVFDTRGPHGPVTSGYTPSNSSTLANDPIANDYRTYISGLSRTDDSGHGPSMSLGGDRRLITGEGGGQHEEDVADRNIDRYRSSLDVSKRKPLPAAPGMFKDETAVLAEAVTATLSKNYVNGLAALDATNGDVPRNGSVGTGSFSSKPSTNPSYGTGKYSLGSNATKGGLKDSILPHVEDTEHETNRWKGADLPLRTPRKESRVGWSRRKPRGSESEEDAPPTPPDNLRHDGPLPMKLKTEYNGASTAVGAQQDIEREIEQLLDGVVDLRDTVDEDKDVTWAPAVTHEVVKTHEHEIIQHKIFREIHNYEHFHHLQPVYDIEVLPPRHWIPNPEGEGLIEISADELPSRTGNNRRWKIVVEQPELSAPIQTQWRTEPKIIEHPTRTTAEGFERKETTIIYPPTLADMTDYKGLVQPIHFDHKTGKRWLSPISTMHELREQMGAVADPGSAVTELPEHLPETPGISEVPSLSSSPEMRRRPAHAKEPARQGARGKHDGIAVVV